MAFFKIKNCDVNQVEELILGSLKSRPIPQNHDAELFGRYTIDDFMGKRFNRWNYKLKAYLNGLPPWIYAICKVFPFYATLRKQLLIGSRIKK